MKATTRLSQSQRARKSARRHDGRPKQAERMSTKLPNTPGMMRRNWRTPKRLPIPQLPFFSPSELRGMAKAMETVNVAATEAAPKMGRPLVAIREEPVTPIPPHTFGTPQNEDFWEGMTRAQLMDEAKDRGIKGRHTMTKGHLVRALAEHEGG